MKVYKRRDRKMKKAIIVKSNDYVLAHYHLETYEQKLILLCISKIKENQLEGKEALDFTLQVSEIKKFLGIKSNDIYRELKNIALKLTGHFIEIETETGFKMIRPFPYAEYENGQFILHFEKSMEPQLINLASNYTQYALDNVKMLKSTYSIRLYEVLKSYEYRKEIKLNLEELKEMIGVKEKIVIDSLKPKSEDNILIKDKYKLYGDFKRRVLVIAQKEIEKNTDIKFEFEEVKTGRKVTQLIFRIYKQHLEKVVSKENVKRKGAKEENQLSFNIYYYHLINECKKFLPQSFTLDEIAVLLEVANENVDLIKEKYMLLTKQRHVENQVGWLIKAIQEDYLVTTLDQTKNTSNKFTNFEQRNYSNEELKKIEQQLIQKQYKDI